MEVFFDYFFGRNVPLSGIRRISVHDTCNNKTGVSNVDDGSYQNNTLALCHQVCSPKTIYIWIYVLRCLFVFVCVFFLFCFYYRAMDWTWTEENVVGKLLWSDYDIVYEQHYFVKCTSEIRPKKMGTEWERITGRQMMLLFILPQWLVDTVYYIWALSKPILCVQWVFFSNPVESVPQK